MTKSLRFWGITSLLFVAFLYLFRDILLPFVLGLGVAYFLSPIADRLQTLVRSRALAAILATLGLYLFIFLFFLLFWPVLENQIAAFIERVPGYLREVREILIPYATNLLAGLAPFPEVEADKILGLAGSIAETILSGGIALFHLVSLLLVTPIVIFYLLRDWDKIVRCVDNWLPKAQAEVIRTQLREIDSTLAGFVRGQSVVCVLLGLFYGIGLTLAGLDFGLVIGIGTGLIAFIPYFGMLIGFAVGITLALLQFSDWLPIAIVAAVFFSGQVIEGSFVTPKLVGERVGLHPVWVIFALFAGGAVGGFLGVLLAVPIAAVIGVMGRFMVQCYLASDYHLATSRGDRSDEP